MQPKIIKYNTIWKLQPGNISLHNKKLRLNRFILVWDLCLFLTQTDILKHIKAMRRNQYCTLFVPNLNYKDKQNYLFILGIIFIGLHPFKTISTSHTLKQNFNPLQTNLIKKRVSYSWPKWYKWPKLSAKLISGTRATSPLPRNDTERDIIIC